MMRVPGDKPHVIYCYARILALKMWNLKGFKYLSLSSLIERFDQTSI